MWRTRYRHNIQVRHRAQSSQSHRQLANGECLIWDYSQHQRIRSLLLYLLIQNNIRVLRQWRASCICTWFRRVREHALMKHKIRKFSIKPEQVLASKVPAKTCSLSLLNSHTMQINFFVKVLECFGNYKHGGGEIVTFTRSKIVHSKLY